MDCQLQTPSKEDLKAIWRINDKVQASPWTLSQIESEIFHQNPFSRVARDRKTGDLLGYLFVRGAGDELEVMIIGVAVKFQRQGIARKLLSEFLRGARGAKPPVSAVFLEVSHLNDAALALYKVMGFEQMGVRPDYYKDGSDAVTMKLNLAKTQ